MGKKRSLLFIMRSLGGGGAERVTLDLLHHLDPSRYSVTVAVLWDRGVLWQDVPGWVTVIPVLKEGASFKKGVPRILATLLKHARRADVIVGAIELDATYVACALAWLTRKPAIGWVHTDLDRYLADWSNIHRVLVKYCYPSIDWIVSPSDGSLEALRRVASVKQERLRVIHNLLNLPEITRKAAEPLPAGSARYFTKPTVLGVGRLDPPKGFDLLIRAHARLMREGHDHNLLILGEGPARKELEALASDQDVAGSVFMPGFQENPYPWFRKAEAFVLSSRFEGFGIVVVEALALGVPVVAADCPSGPSEILDNGRYGILVPAGNVPELARGISKALTDERLCSELSSGGPGRAAAFSSNNIVPQWESLFQEAVQ